MNPVHEFLRGKNFWLDTDGIRYLEIFLGENDEAGDLVFWD